MMVATTTTMINGPASRQTALPTNSICMGEATRALAEFSCKLNSKHFSKLNDSDFRNGFLNPSSITELPNLFLIQKDLVFSNLASPRNSNIPAWCRLKASRALEAR